MKEKCREVFVDNFYCHYKEEEKKNFTNTHSWRSTKLDCSKTRIDEQGMINFEFVAKIRTADFDSEQKGKPSPFLVLGLNFIYFFFLPKLISNREVFSLRLLASQIDCFMEIWIVQTTGLGISGAVWIRLRI